jgi:hypothetical protein
MAFLSGLLNYKKNKLINKITEFQAVFLIDGVF